MKLMNLIISSLLIFLTLTITISYADEIVINSKNQPVLLKNDGSWELINTHGEDGKIVIRINKTLDLGRMYHTSEDDFGNIKDYFHDVGCKYFTEVTNNTNNKVKVMNFKYIINDKRFSSDGIFPENEAMVDIDRVINPGDTFSTENSFRMSIITKEFKAKTEFSKDRIADLLLDFGCEAQRGKVHVQIRGNGAAFPPEANVSNNAVNSFFVTSSNSPHPLKKKIEFK